MSAVNGHCEYCGSERVVWDTRSGLASVANGTLNILVSIVEFFGALIEGIFGGGGQTYRRNDSPAAAARKEWALPRLQTQRRCADPLIMMTR